MADLDRANRIKESIKKHGGYDVVSDKTGINARTLKRMALGETEPKFKDIIALNNITKLSCDYYAYGTDYAVEQLEKKAEANTEQAAKIINDLPQKGEQGGELFEFLKMFIDLTANSIDSTVEKSGDKGSTEFEAFSHTIKNLQSKLKQSK